MNLYLHTPGWSCMYSFLILNYIVYCSLLHIKLVNSTWLHSHGTVLHSMEHCCTVHRISMHSALLVITYYNSMSMLYTNTNNWYIINKSIIIITCNNLYNCFKWFHAYDLHSPQTYRFDMEVLFTLKVYPMCRRKRMVLKWISVAFMLLCQAAPEAHPLISSIIASRSRSDFLSSHFRVCVHQCNQGCLRECRPFCIDQWRLQMDDCLYPLPVWLLMTLFYWKCRVNWKSRSTKPSADPCCCMEHNYGLWDGKRYVWKQQRWECWVWSRMWH